MDPKEVRCFTEGLQSGEYDRMMTMNNKDILLQCLSQETEEKKLVHQELMAYSLVSHLLRSCGQLNNSVNE